MSSAKDRWFCALLPFSFSRPLPLPCIPLLALLLYPLSPQLALHLRTRLGVFVRLVVCDCMQLIYVAVATQLTYRATFPLSSASAARPLPLPSRLSPPSAVGLWLPWQVLHSTRGYCGSPGTVGTADGYCRVLWVLQGTVGIVGTARAKVTVGYCGSTRGYCQRSSLGASPVPSCTRTVYTV